MAHHRCVTCDLKTGVPASHPTCNGAPTRWEVCTCGSGGHPRRCDLHPGAYEKHIREIEEDADPGPPSED